MEQESENNHQFPKQANIQSFTIVENWKIGKVDLL